MRPLFFFGAMSPYSWFAAERIGGLLPGAEWRPVLAGALFRAAGRVTWGLTDERAAKISDCEARAREHGLGPIRWPEPWPTRDLAVARAMIVARDEGLLQPFALAAMRLSFREGVDLGETAAVLEAARRSGLDPPLLAERIEHLAIKLALREATEEATSRGVIGVPTVAVGEELFWGDDRLEEAAAAVRAGAHAAGAGELG